MTEVLVVVIVPALALVLVTIEYFRVSFFPEINSGLNVEI